jgi:hypothetical protein
MQHFYYFCIIIWGFVSFHVLALADDGKSSFSAASPHFCASAFLKSPGRIQQAVENTKRSASEVYRLAQQLQQTASPEIIGSRRTFFAYNLRRNQYEVVAAELRAIGEQTQVWVQTSEIANGHVDSTNVPTLILRGFEQTTPSSSRDPKQGIKQIDEEYFGLPPNIDSAGRKGSGSGVVTILLLDIQDFFNGIRGHTGGYFDLIDQKVEELFSNRRDIIYLDTWPSITISEKNHADVQEVLATLAHEYQHLIHYNYDPDETIFVDEGAAQYASYLCGYGFPNPTDYFDVTNVPLFDWDHLSGNVFVDYDRARLWTLYLAEQVGDAVIKEVVQSPLHDIEGYSEALRKVSAKRDFLTLFQSWLVANAVNDTALNSAYGYRLPGITKVKPLYLYVNPNVEFVSSSLNRLAAEYIYYGRGDSLRIQFTAGFNVVVKAIEIGKTKKRVVNVPVNALFFEPEFGSTYNDIIFVLVNTSLIFDSQYYYSSSGYRKTVSVEEQGQPAQSFMLYQNYPNPFNPSTSIQFRVSSFGFVQLKVFDVLGREVATLVNEWKEAGTHSITFDIRNSSFDILASGVYFYRLSVYPVTPGSLSEKPYFTETRKMILAR